MAMLAINFNEVPDVVPPVAPGILLLSVESISDVTDIPASDKKPAHRQIVVEHKVKVEGSPDFDRVIKKKIDVDKDKTLLKNLYHACKGVRPGVDGFDPDVLKDCTCMAEVNNFSFIAQDGKTVTMAGVQKYLTPES